MSSYTGNAMSSYANNTTGRRRQITRTDAEEKALDKISREAEARMRVKRETREQARQHRYTLLEKRVEVDFNINYHVDNPIWLLLYYYSRRMQRCTVKMLLLHLMAYFTRKKMILNCRSQFKKNFVVDILDTLLSNFIFLEFNLCCIMQKFQEVKLLKRTIEAMTATQNSLKIEIMQRDQLIQAFIYLFNTKAERENTSHQGSRNSQLFFLKFKSMYRRTECLIQTRTFLLSTTPSSRIQMKPVPVNKNNIYILTTLYLTILFMHKVNLIVNLWIKCAIYHRSLSGKINKANSFRCYFEIYCFNSNNYIFLGYIYIYIYIYCYYVHFSVELFFFFYYIYAFNINPLLRIRKTKESIGADNNEEGQLTLTRRLN
uniref:BZIP domain-containing protein n=1 Tax=Heterorhabditis bacteriophora TaxID=37862 RepID=A0A1I7WJF5_HETBA